MNAHLPHRLVAPFLALTLWAGVAAAQVASPDQLWQGVDRIPAAPFNARPGIRPAKFKAFTLDATRLRSALVKAPLEFTASATSGPGVRITLPMPDGTFARFQIEESPVMEPALAAKYPEIKSYRGRGLDDRAALLRFDVNGKTFHAQVLSPSGVVYIDPYWQHEGGVYMSYAKSDLKADGRDFKCLVGSAQPDASLKRAMSTLDLAGTGTTLRTYRLACATSLMYSQYHGGTVPVVADVLAAMVTMVNRISGVYETEFAIKMVLVANNDLIIASATNPTPYNDTPGDLFLNPAYIDARIGADNYDIGHVVTTGSGGVAGLGVVCGGLDPTYGGSAKAAGTTGINPPIGDGFWIDYVAHEMGHEFGGNHPFNGDGTNCGATNQNAATAYEPGSGSTIMAYAGICGAANDLQPHSDAYFHFISLEEISAYTSGGTGSSCPVETPTGNSPPTVSARDAGVPAPPTIAYNIPDQTSFTLTAFNGADPNNDSLTYCWEEADLGPEKAGTAPDNGSSALFRSFNPTTKTTRTFPRWSDLLTNNNQNIGEKLPLTTRNLDFRVSARDNRGGFDIDSIRLHSVNSGTGFAVTSPNTAITWTGGGTETVTWDVAGTTANGINTANVNILLSTDAAVGPAGEDPTFPIVLAANTPNDGSQSITVPFVNTTKARVMVQAVGNVYFDVSNANFTINSPVQPAQLVSAVSRKTHNLAGTFDIALPLIAPFGVECRSGGASNDYTLVFTFDNPLTAVGGATVSSGTVQPASAINPGNSLEYILELTGVTTGQNVTATLNNINGTGTAAITVGVLVGDVNANKAVSNTDVSSVKGQVSSTVTASNFRNDVTANGTLSNTDVSATKAQVSTTLP